MDVTDATVNIISVSNSLLMTCVFCTYMQVYMADESASKLQLVVEFGRSDGTIPESGGYLTLLRQSKFKRRLRKAIL